MEKHPLDLNALKKPSPFIGLNTVFVDNNPAVKHTITDHERHKTRRLWQNSVSSFDRVWQVGQSNYRDRAIRCTGAAVLHSKLNIRKIRFPSVT